jgi:hypothetical protein
MEKQNLLKLFEVCLECKYTQVENDGSFAIKKDGSHLYIYFEKSNGPEDWEHNFNFPATPYHDMPKSWYCHRGFLKVWKSIEPYLVDNIMDPDIRSVIIIGYSHGAAIATLCHEYVWFNRPDLRENIIGYGFGCPRIFWGLKIPEVLKERWVNFMPVCNINDLITHLPPKILGYCHVNNLLFIGKRGNYNGIDAHRQENYITELKKLNL